MKADYKNWVPAGMIISLSAGAGAALILALLFGALGVGVSGTLRIVLGAVFGLAFLVCAVMAGLMFSWRRAFSYTGKRQLARQIVEGTAACVQLEAGQVGLDVGCGSGALTIACARRSPAAQMVGVDRWGREYASFSRALCERNARAECATNVRFQRGDAMALPFADGTFDAVVSNYVYHNIAGADKQALLRETLRVLKKGGSFAIHDIMSPARYGDMQAFVRRLRDEGYERAELIDTTDGLFMEKSEARRLMLSGSTLLVGKK